jgi:hypothetical protein
MVIALANDMKSPSQSDSIGRSQLYSVLTHVSLILALILLSFDAHAISACERVFSERPSVNFAEWAKNPDWSGESPIPEFAEGRVEISDVNHPTSTRIYFSAAESTKLSSDLRRLIGVMRKDAGALTTEEAEMGAIVAHYGDGTSKGIRFSSRRKDIGLFAIAGEDQMQAINRSFIFPSKLIKHLDTVIHLHTHPNLRNPRFGGRRSLVLPSVDDFEFWLGLRAQLRRHHDNPRFQAIVAPFGPAVENIVFVIEDRHLDAYMRDKVNRLAQ